MVIKTIDIDLLNPAAYNPRVDLQKGDKEFTALENSIDKYGYGCNQNCACTN